MITIPIKTITSSMRVSIDFYFSAGTTLLNYFLSVNLLFKCLNLRVMKYCGVSSVLIQQYVFIFLNRAYTVGHHINHGATQTETVIIKLVLDSVAW